MFMQCAYRCPTDAAARTRDNGFLVPVDRQRRDLTLLKNLRILKFSEPSQSSGNLVQKSSPCDDI